MCLNRNGKSSERVLDELGRIWCDASQSHHERFLEVYRLLQDRNYELAQAFDGPRRSQMLMQLVTMHTLGLLEAEDLARFTPKTQETIAALAEFSSE
jgi:hypothetical protein